jgi:hypothetical protein
LDRLSVSALAKMVEERFASPGSCLAGEAGLVTFAKKKNNKKHFYCYFDSNYRSPDQLLGTLVSTSTIAYFRVLQTQTMFPWPFT